jgi:hypothetical protein
MHLCWAWLPFIALTVLLLPLGFRLGMHRIDKDGKPFSGAMDWSWNYWRRRNFDAEGQRLFTWVRRVQYACYWLSSLRACAVHEASLSGSRGRS